jgi:hypothetical protein
VTARRQPDALSAAARRWVGQVGVNTSPQIIERVLQALRRDYDDVIVLEGIVRWRIEHGLRSEQPMAVGSP